MKYKRATKISFLLSAIFFLYPSLLQAQKIDDIQYDLNASTYTATVVHHDYEGDVNIPETVTFLDRRYTVTYIERGAFDHCPFLTSLSIPSTVKLIDDFASYAYGDKFLGCIGLKAIHVDEDNPAYTSDNGVLFNKDKTELYLYPKAKEGEYVVPSSVTAINRFAFSGCYELESVFIHKNVTQIGDFAFFDCSNTLLWIESGNEIAIDQYTFSGLDEHSSTIVAPGEQMTDIQTVWEGKVYDIVQTPCVALDLQPYAKGCTFKIVKNPTKLTVRYTVPFVGDIRAEEYTDDLYIVKGLSPGTDYKLSLKNEVTAAGQAFWEEVFSLPFTTQRISVVPTVETQQGGITVTDVSATEDITARPIAYGVVCSEQDYPVSPPAPTQINGLRINSIYHLRPYAVYDDGEKVFGAYYECTTLNLLPRCYASQKTNTKLNLYVTCSADETVDIEEKGVMFNNRYYRYDGSTPILFDGLRNNTTYKFQPYIIYNNGKYHFGTETAIATQSIRPSVRTERVSPTVLEFQASYTLIDAQVDSAWLTCNGQTYAELPCRLTGLDPNTTYNATYSVRTTCGVVESATVRATTSPLQLTTLQPQGVSSTCSIVAASTNIDDEEAYVGFQWKKYDAPESLAPKDGRAAIRDGQLEGYIKNLQPTSYYNVRAFYLSDAGNYYYADWVTFDPSDFSYFEPTVRTYPVESLSAHSAILKGYVLPGTDEIVEQGFQYWPQDISHRKPRHIHADVASPVDEQATTVLATGQIMSVALTGLEAGTTYGFRAFVKTISGTTYGEEQTFTTETTGHTGIIDKPAEKGTPTISSYYDLCGRKLDTPQQGICIVRYSDGTTRKILIR